MERKGIRQGGMSGIPSDMIPQIKARQKQRKYFGLRAKETKFKSQVAEIKARMATKRAMALDKRTDQLRGRAAMLQQEFNLWLQVFENEKKAMEGIRKMVILASKDYDQRKARARGAYKRMLKARIRMARIAKASKAWEVMEAKYQEVARLLRYRSTTLAQNAFGSVALMS